MRRAISLILLLVASQLFVMRANAAGITVTFNEAEGDFPTSLQFELEATSEAEITEVLLLYTEGLDETLIEVQPEFAPATEVEVSYTRDTQTYFLPTGITIRYKWLIRDAAGNMLETPLREVLYEDQRFDWQQHSEQGVTVRWYEGGEEFGRELTAAVSRTLERFEQQFESKLTQPVRITIYANADDMRAALGPNPREWIGGEARPDLGLIIGAIQPGDVDEIKRLIPHELSHIVLHQASATPYGAGTPFWFDEGLAVVNEEVPSTFFDQQVEEAARTGQLIPLEALASPFPADYEKALLSYGQSAGVVRYIFERYSQDQLAELIDQFSNGATPNEATTTALGVTIDELDAQWRETLPPVTDPAPTATSALHAPQDRFDVTTPERAPASRPRGGTPGFDGGTLVGGLPLPLVIGGLLLGGILLLTGMVLILRAMRR